LALFSKRSILPHEDAMLDGLSSAIALAIQQAAAEAALQKVLDDLEARVEQRTNELTQANESMRGEITERRKAEAAQATAQSERDAVELRLRQAQKLEAVGQLAAGIAHEINTPAQFVGDSVQFLSGAFRDLLPLFQKYRQAGLALATVPGMAELAREMSEAAEAADLVYVEASAQESFARALDGISRIASIVRAMKEFAHPDSREKGFADLNQALKTTLTIAHNEYKYVADVETSLADIPLVPCHLGDINQVFLNLLVNAAHAIGDVVGNSGSRGRILVRTVQDGANLRVDIEDSGCGIPLEIRDRIFDPFFTTKPVGKGSGQGLAIARSIIVDRHGGDLTFESVLGKGTTFTIRLPISAPSEGKADGTVG
jgi:signal transduction histidine kinase